MDNKKLEDLLDLTWARAYHAGLEAALSGKQNVINDLAAIRSGAALGTTSVQPSAMQAAIADFITRSVNDLANYYLKTDTYTKTEVQALIAAINQFHYEVYPSTSAVTSPANNVLYLIGPTGQGSDKYEEYVYPNSTTGWVKIGDTSIDLSGYVTTTALNTALASYYTKTQADNLLANYVSRSEYETAMPQKQDKLTFDEVPTKGSNNPVTSDGIAKAIEEGQTEPHEQVTVTATANKGNVGTPMLTIYDENDEVLATGEGTVSLRLKYGTTYKVGGARAYDYLTPAVQTFTAGQIMRDVSLEYTYIERDVVTLDQSITDPDTMLSGDIQGDVIKQIRANSHLYLGTSVTQEGDEEGAELICQLDDEDSTKYADGTTAALDGTEGDQWMKLPVFWWKITGIGEPDEDGVCDRYSFAFAFDGEPDPTWNKWEGEKNLLGAKEMTVIDDVGHSISGGTSTGSFTRGKGNTYAGANNLGCQQVTWEWQWMMCMLFYAWYGNTNSQAVCGIGSNSYTRTLGVTDGLGMTDTTPSQATSLTSARFWGLEAWWNCKSEWLGNVTMSGYVLTIKDMNTKQNRTVNGFVQCGGDGGYINRMRIDSNGDFIPVAKDGTATTSYCDYTNSNSGSRVLCRSYSHAYSSGGVAYVGAYFASSYTGANSGSRLAFNGVVTEAQSVAAYKAALANGE